MNYKFRMHDPRLGRFFAVDPLFKDFPWNSPYAFCENSTIAFIELEGLEKVVYYWRYDAKSKELIAIRHSNGNQIHGIYPDGTTNYHTVTGLFINGKYKEISGDVLNASCELMKNGNKVNNIKWDRERSISESWASFAKTTHGKNFIQTIKNVATVASMVVTGGTLGVATKLGKFKVLLILG